MTKHNITFKTNISNNVREEMIANKAQIVCPVVATKVGVMNSLFYSEKELAAFNVGWNGSPITVGHPSLNGEYVNANNPIIDNKERDTKQIIINYKNNDYILEDNILYEIIKTKGEKFGTLINSKIEELNIEV